MELLAFIGGIIAIIIAILPIILFFKIWGACNDIAAIKNTICEGGRKPKTPETKEEIEEWLNKGQK